MGRIPGTTLDMAWPELGWIGGLRLAFQLRRVIKSLEVDCFILIWITGNRQMQVI